MANSTYLKALAFMALTAFATSATAQTWTVKPAAGFINEPITSVTITIDNATDLQFSSRALLYYDPSESVDKTGIIYFNGDAYLQEEGNYEATISGNTVTFTAKSHGGVWDEKDKYDLRIPAGAITYMQNGRRTNCPLINVTWFYSDLTNLQISPAPGKVNDLSSFTVSVPEGFSFSSSYFYPNMMMQFGPKVYLADRNNEPTGNAVAYYNLADGVTKSDIVGKREVTFAHPTTADISRSEWKPTDGEKYVIQIQKSSLTIKNNASKNSDYCPKTNFVFTYTEGSLLPQLSEILGMTYPENTVVNYNPEAEDNAGMSMVIWSLNGQGITINRDCKENVNLYYEGNLLSSIEASDTDRITSYSVSPAAVSDDDPIATGIDNIAFNFAGSNANPADFTRSGSYRVEVPTGLLTSPEGDIEGTSVTYTLNNVSVAVEAIGADNTVTVYSASGILLLQDAPAAELATLPAGLYIVNGKKLIINY